MVYYEKMTQQGFDQLGADIEALKKQRPGLIKALQAARALGDLSENAEYSAAKRDLRHLESRLRYLGKQRRYADIVHPQANAIVEIGKTVDLRFDDDDDTDTYAIVGKPEADLDAQKISQASPLGAALLGHTVGDTVTVQAPSGTYPVTIQAVRLTSPPEG
ncbi:transcription elongation factor GreA [Schleiferilactobacillus harbinensis]|jgi:transcription elongation factor GreA|nr:transcription elongation factor GreA [Schleiferilactobacillus harbinensis]HAY52563.1 transcription elongation factor GreA [Lactobacillus sp.]MBO3090968.1 transcription elongation factor GreA [Schleiferilactobacillus harbinensis]QFR22352.1 transcription elongation factor GreA [Schleiferilactobacillus harbinensis]QFR63916.1 transcription elongation factor GreA [Schleiferilactobacillus harbinensis]GEK05471.1 transcription elongation factor GreA [Schleiferilactobacillus harbinensis]